MNNPTSPSGLSIVKIVTIVAVVLGTSPFSKAHSSAEIFGFPGYNFAYGALISDSAGNFYGTTNLGGTGSCNLGCGTVFELSPTAGGNWTETVLYDFAGGNDGANPTTGLTFDAAGSLYGTTQTGGGVCGCGTAFRISPANGSWKETVLYSFTGRRDGRVPSGPLTIDASGNLYGTTVNGGEPDTCQGGCGIVYRLSPRGNDVWEETVLYAFTGKTDGATPAGSLALVGRSLYGATVIGGTRNGCHQTGCGVVFQLTPAGSGWIENVLYSFSGGTDGNNPSSGITADSKGNLFGTTTYGGDLPSCPRLGCGVIFALLRTPGYRIHILYSFKGNDDGGFPGGQLAIDGSGNIFAESIDPTWCSSFISTCGEVVELSRVANDWQLVAKYHVPNDWSPSGGVALTSTGSIFGMGNGSTETGASGVFEIVP